MNKTIIMSSIAGAVTGFLTLTASANAMTANRPAGHEPSFTKVVNVVCIRDDRGWHRMHHNRRVTCRPVRPSREWGWHTEGGRSGWWHQKERRWHD
jgi:hypothetical protein